MKDDIIKLIGKLITSPADKDAIHIAVAPVKAGEVLNPGQNVGIIDNSHTIPVVGRSDNPIGIVDPYLKNQVRAGQDCFLFLYPATIKSIRHEWEHPAFKNNKLITEAKERLMSLASKWGFSYERLIEGIGEEYINFGDQINTMERARDDEEQLIDDYEIITGKRVSDITFSCAC